MLDHNENFELESEYEKIWNKIRYKKVDEIYEHTEEVMKILDKHINETLLFHSDYEKIQNLFKKMKQKNFFYMSGSAKELIKSANPKFENIFERRECIRDLKYIGTDDTEFKSGEIYKSSTFSGATYEINVNGKVRTMGCNHFERVS